jgi:hypothetical protein
MRRGQCACELDERYLIRAEDGALIDIVNRGHYRAATAVLVEVSRHVDVYVGPGHRCSLVGLRN